MLNYTESLRLLIEDIIRRVPDLGHIDPARLLVFARHGRTGADGPIATCHSLTLPESEPGYYYWEDAQTGLKTRRSHWFVMKSPDVVVNGRPVAYMLSFSLPRFCDQSLQDYPRKRALYSGEPDWIAKLDTVVHELYHVDPAGVGLREHPDSRGMSFRYHSPTFFEDVRRLVGAYLATDPDPALSDFLRANFEELQTRHGVIVATAFRGPHPQRYSEALAVQPLEPRLEIAPMTLPKRRDRFGDQDLALRVFSREGSRPRVEATSGHAA
jgi:hypothetical protein